MADTNPHSDVTAYEVVKGNIVLPYDVTLKVFPKTASDDFTQATPFSYQQDVGIRSLLAFPYYDADSRTFSFDLWFPTPSDDAIATAQTQLIAQYQQPAGSDQAALLQAAKLVPLPIVAYEVYLVARGSKLLLQNDSRDDGGSFDQNVAIRPAPIADDAVHQYIKDHSTDVAFAVRLYNLMEIEDAATAVAQSFSQGVTNAYSKVFGASADPTLIVNRNASDDLKQQLQSDVLIELHIPNGSANASLMTNVIFDYMATLKPVALADLQNSSRRSDSTGRTKRSLRWSRSNTRT